MRPLPVHDLRLLRPIETWAQLNLQPLHLGRYGVHVKFFSEYVAFAHGDEAVAFWENEPNGGLRYLARWNPS
jgi:hypothetical protein